MDANSLAITQLDFADFEVSLHATDITSERITDHDLSATRYLTLPGIPVDVSQWTLSISSEDCNEDLMLTQETLDPQAAMLMAIAYQLRSLPGLDARYIPGVSDELHIKNSGNDPITLTFTADGPIPASYTQAADTLIVTFHELAEFGDSWTTQIDRGDLTNVFTVTSDAEIALLGSLADAVNRSPHFAATYRPDMGITLAISSLNHSDFEAVLRADTQPLAPFHASLPSNTHAITFPGLPYYQDRGHGRISGDTWTITLDSAGSSPDHQVSNAAPVASLAEMLDSLAIAITALDGYTASINPETGLGLLITRTDTLPFDVRLATTNLAAEQISVIRTLFDAPCPDHLSTCVGNDDQIETGGGSDVVIAGAGADVVNTESGGDMVVGDAGQAYFNSDLDDPIEPQNLGILRHVRTITAEVGGPDAINTDEGRDTVIGGAGKDVVNTYLGDEDDSNEEPLGLVRSDIALGDNGYVRFEVDGSILEAGTTEPDVGDDDTITTRNGADIAFGGTGNDLITTGTEVSGDVGRDLVLGDSGVARFDGDGRVDQIESNATSIGGRDLITTGGGPDVIFAGADRDEIYSQAGDDVVAGDNATATFDDDRRPIRIESIAPLDGDDDLVYAGDDDDVVFGGSLNDTLYGNPGHDVLLGDHGQYDVTRNANQRHRSIFTYNQHAGGVDHIYGQAGHDMILGQQAADYLYGGEDEDDITGGHNFLELELSGHDEGDYIEGGAAADVIIGDNGEILREPVSTNPWIWKRYPAGANTDQIQLDDIIRHVTRYDDPERMRFDDANAMYGDDLIYGDQPNTTANLSDGHDVVFGQRGDDTIYGGGGDDELIGEIGDDFIQAGAGHDVVLGDLGEIMRDYVNPELPRVNNNGMWHRDIILQDHGTVTDVIASGTAPTLANAEQLVESDLLLVAGRYDPTGRDRVAETQWDTYTVLVDIHAANNDILQGGDGDDIILGQRGDDQIDGDAGDDFLVGDKGRHNTSSALQLPLIFDGLRLFGGSHVGMELSDAGTFVLTPISLYPEQLAMNDGTTITRGYGNVLSAEVNEAIRQMDGGVLWRTPTEGGQSGFLPVASMIPRAPGNQHVLPGNDTITGDAGSDWIIGDNSVMESQIRTGIPAIEALFLQLATELKLATHSMRYLALDATAQFGIDAVSPSAIFASDTLSGSTELFVDGETTVVAVTEGQLDTVVGDNQHTVTEIHQGMPTTENQEILVTRLLDYVHDTRIAILDLESLIHAAHREVLLSARDQVSTFDISSSTLQFGNDTIGPLGQTTEREAGFITGDTALRLHATVTGTDLPIHNELNRMEEATLDRITQYQETLNSIYRDQVSSHPLLQSQPLTEADLARAPADREHNLRAGNDQIHASPFNDVVFGDFSTYMLPVVNQCSIDRALGDSADTCRQNNSLADLDQLKSLNHAERLTLIAHIHQRLTATRRYTDNFTHKKSFDLFEENYTGSSKDAIPLYRHPLYGHRGEAQVSASISAGNDYIDGGHGDDVLLGDSETFYTELVLTANGITRLANVERDSEATTFTLDLTRKFHANHQPRSQFEIKDHYVRTPVSTPDPQSSGGGLDNDYLLGNYGDDILMGQQNYDFLAIDPGNDVRFGGSHHDDVDMSGICHDANTEDCDDPNTTLADGPDRPDHAELQALKERVLSAVPNVTISPRWSRDIVMDTLADTLLTPEHSIQTNQTNLGWVTSDEAVNESQLGLAQNPQDAADVTADGLITPLDALRIIDRLNQPLGNDAVPVGAGGTPSVFLDVNGDGLLTNLDALIVINRLNSEFDGQAGEGESLRSGSFPREQPVRGERHVPSSPEAAVRTTLLNHPLTTGSKIIGFRREEVRTRNRDYQKTLDSPECLLYPSLLRQAD